MKMTSDSESRTVQSGGLIETFEFKFGESAKAQAKGFKITINKIYSDKPRAVVREIWTNAIDSHTRAGRADVPFDCHLPTMFEPWFSVRDYGTSMTHELVRDVYSVAFETTKDESNDETGMFGLGSKTPFCYTDTYSLTCILGGLKRFYSVFLNEQERPIVGLIGSSETDEPDGVEVSFPVAIKDVSAFSRSAAQVVQGLDVVPNFIGDAYVTKDEPAGETGDGWFITNSMTNLPAALYARQGPVLYPIDFTAIPVSKTTGIFYRSKGIIDFKIGSLNPTAAREGLEYDEATIASIESRLAEIYGELVDRYSGRYDQFQTLWDARVAAAQEFKLADSIVKVMISDASWRGAPIVTPASMMKFGKKQFRSQFALEPYPRITFDLPAHTKSQQCGVTVNGGWSNKNAKFKPTSSVVINARRTVIYFQDTAAKHVTLASERIYNHAHDYSDLPQLNVIWVKGSKRTLGRVLVSLGRPDASKMVVNVSSLPAPQRDKKAREQAREIRRLPFNCGQNFTEYFQKFDSEYLRSDAIQKFYVNKFEGSYYRDSRVEKNSDGIKFVNFDGRVFTGCVSLAIDALRLEGAFPAGRTDGVLVIGKSFHGLLKTGKWSNIIDLADGVVRDRADAILRAIAVRSIFSDSSAIRNIALIAELVKPASPIVEISRTVSEVSESVSAQLRKYAESEWARIFGADLWSDAKYQSIVGELAEVKKHPILWTAINMIGLNGITAQHVAEYADTIF